MITSQNLSYAPFSYKRRKIHTLHIYKYYTQTLGCNETHYPRAETRVTTNSASASQLVIIKSIVTVVYRQHVKRIFLDRFMYIKLYRKFISFCNNI